MTTERPITVLLVDDEGEVLAALRRALASTRYRVLETTQPQQAIAWLACEDIDVIVSDIDMPEMSGIELMRIARFVRPGAVRIVVSGAGTVDTTTRAINECEVHRFIHKPFEPAVLRTVIAEAIERQQELRRSAEATRSIERRQLLFDQLEGEHPGVTQLERDDDGAYVIDEARARARAAAVQLEPFLREDTPTEH